MSKLILLFAMALVLAIACGILVLILYLFTNWYIQVEGEKANLSQKEINEWKYKAVLFGCVPGLILFKRKIKVNNK